jgi:hypothetical protein
MPHVTETREETTEINVQFKLNYCRVGPVDAGGHIGY